ncbi:hypothetical protein B0I35DRAFT_440513 [Stachybotrys elegans]|uniref:Uncharacterized protein n=1 Tax=Stachybotrys elegans TaxID=80388 RepID=A0A8K0SMN4_9HYPO|nr:hypothetical protein B0I35DRAFT_440513 [Stachybotrys elegans]
MEDTKARFQELGNVPTAFFDDVYYFKLLPPLRNIFTSLGRRSLASRLSMAEVFQAPLGPNGWHKDIYRWLAISMSYLQLRLVETTMGPSFSNDNSIFEQFVIRPPENETQQFCHSQKIRSTNYTSFSMFWLIFTFVVGMLVIVAANTVESVLHFIQRTFFPRSSRYHRLEWRAGQALHLQRLAHNELEPQEWKQGFLDVPVTAKITSLAVLDADVHVGLPCIMRANETILSDESETKDSKHMSSHLEVFQVNDHSQEFTTDARPSYTKDGVAERMRVAEEPKEGNDAVSRENEVQDQDDDLMETGSVHR